MLTKEPESMLGGAVRLIETATAERFVPGAAVGVVNSAGRTAIAVAGAAQWTPQPVDLTAEMWFDLASLTKVMVTVPEVLRLRQAGEIALDDSPLGGLRVRIRLPL